MRKMSLATIVFAVSGLLFGLCCWLNHKVEATTSYIMLVTAVYSVFVAGFGEGVHTLVCADKKHRYSLLNVGIGIMASVLGVLLSALAF